MILYESMRQKSLNHNIVLPSARGIELMLLGGIKPTSVTTAVIYVGGVKSYSGFSFSRLFDGEISSDFDFLFTIDSGTAIEAQPTSFPR